MLQALQAPTDPARWGSAATDLDLHAALTESAAAAGDIAALSRYAARLEADARAVGHRLYQAIALRALAQAATRRRAWGEAEPLVQQALEIFHSLGARWQEGRTLLTRAHVRAATSPDQARADRLQAEAILQSIGADIASAETAPPNR